MIRTRDERISGTPQEPLASRLWRDLAAGLAAHAGCCPLHGTRLICALHDVAWTASAHEQVEVEALLERTALYDLTWPMWPCARCDTQDVALCLDCYEPVREQAFAGLTLAEEARVVELVKKTARFTFLPAPDAADTGEPSHEGADIS